MIGNILNVNALKRAFHMHEKKIKGVKKYLKIMSRSGIEPETYCVLGNCDNQLHHRDPQKREKENVDYIAT